MFKIPKEYLNLKVECGECERPDTFKNTPDIVVGHLLEAHDYNVGEAEEWVTWWMNEFRESEDGKPLGMCKLGHIYKLGEECEHCESIDLDIDYWKERKHA